MNDIIDYYSRHSERLTQRYEKLAPEMVNAAWAHLVPESKSAVLDVGAGSGRDAAWFADRGHRVVAVEPADNLRKKANALHPHPAIQWVNDRLPVWMHLSPILRSRAFGSLYTLLNHAGILIISVRQGPAAGRPAMFPIAGDELLNLARQFALDIVLNTQNDDMYHRTDIWWQTVVLRREN